MSLANWAPRERPEPEFLQGAYVRLERFGFQFEGVFRNDMVVKGKARDTAWLAITDEDWPALKAAYEVWLAPDNFDSAGQQARSLETLRI